MYIFLFHVNKTEMHNNLFLDVVKRYVEKNTVCGKIAFLKNQKLSIGKIILLIYFFVKNEANTESLMRKQKIKTEELL
jgi:hypothetical protein